MDRLPPFIRYSEPVALALSAGLPVVALESSALTHGLPYPQNCDLANDMEKAIEQEGVTPAIIAVLDGVLQVGLDSRQLWRITTGQNLVKIGSRDIASVIAQGKSGGTTVSGTLVAAQIAGIKVFATGGIGGVHRQPKYDVSADLIKLANAKVVVVCSGAKAILDLPGTVEQLETLGIPVLGYQTDEFPAFYSRSSGMKVAVTVETVDQVVRIAQTHWEMGIPSAILVVVPPPEESALPVDYIQEVIDQALNEAEGMGVRGQELTPFLLGRIVELTNGASLRVNLGLLRNNAQVAALIAQRMVQTISQKKA